MPGFVPSAYSSLDKDKLPFLRGELNCKNDGAVGFRTGASDPSTVSLAPRCWVCLTNGLRNLMLYWCMTL
jgi:hypothetical protein